MQESSHPTPHFHPRQQTPESKDKKIVTLECKESDKKSKISHLKNEKHKENGLTLVKLESKNKAKKFVAE